MPCKNKIKKGAVVLNFGVLSRDYEYIPNTSFFAEYNVAEKLPTWPMPRTPNVVFIPCFKCIISYMCVTKISLKAECNRTYTFM